MPINHILLYKFKSGIDRIDEHLDHISTFEGNTPGLLSLDCGRNVSGKNQFTHGFVMCFESDYHLSQYNKSEAHAELVSKFRDDMDDKLVIDLEI